MKTQKKGLRPLNSMSMTDRVENILREYFQENAFKPGDPLPNEVEIADKLNVSRNVVREALSRLRMLGMIESRTRRGMVMARPDILGGIERVLNPFILGKDTLKDIFELRLILEMGIAEFLFARKNQEEIEELEAIVERKSALPEPTKEDEIEFHGKLYNMTGNETFKRFQILLLPVFEYVFEEYTKKEKKIQVTRRVTHKDLLNVLKKGNPEKFREAMRVHLAPYYRIIL